MSLFAPLINAFRRRTTDSPPRTGVLIHPRREDTIRDYPADGLTPQRLSAIFREADAGALSAQMALFEQMEEKDAHLYSVANTRRLAITGLPWTIVPAGEAPGANATSGGDTGLALEAAGYCERTLRDLDGFEEALAHLSLAVGRNLAVVELVWEAAPEGVRLAAVAPIDFARLAFDDFDQLRILTEAEPIDGIAPPPDKFIVHTPHASSGHAARGGLLRVTAMAFIAKHFAIKDWLIFAEVFGMPVRIARYQPGAAPEEKRELLDMLRRLGADATGIFSKAVDIDIKQTRVPGETNLYEGLCHYFDREISKAWLGQTLTTDTIRNRASAGAASVHDRVRRDLREDDLRKESHTLRRDLLAPLVRFRFGPEAPVPHFRRVLDQTLEPERLAAVLSTAVNELGLRIPADWAHTALGVPIAAAGEPTVAPVSNR
jgi:phage gp29-like protein